MQVVLRESRSLAHLLRSFSVNSNSLFSPADLPHSFISSSSSGSYLPEYLTKQYSVHEEFSAYDSYVGA
jgi:hypothetical protein